MAERNQIGRKTVNFFNRYIAERGQRNADLAPAGDGRLFQGGSTRGVPEGHPEHEITKGSPIDRFGKPKHGPRLGRIKR